MKQTLASILLMLCAVVVSAQYCGHSGNPSGPGQCTPVGLPYEGFERSDSVAPFINGEISTTVIQFQNFDTVWFGGQFLILQSLRIDSIGNLPDGLCWATNKPNNTFTTNETGCIKITGVTCDQPGQYKLKIRVSPNFGVPVTIDDEGDGPKLIVRVKNAVDPNTPIDTTQTRSNQFIPYGNPIAGCTPTATTYLDVKQAYLSISPNPFRLEASVLFTSTTAGQFTQSITTLTGMLIQTQQVQIKEGENSLSLPVGNLPAGMYFYTISDGSNQTTRKIIVE